MPTTTSKTAAMKIAEVATTPAWRITDPTRGRFRPLTLSNSGAGTREVA